MRCVVLFCLLVVCCLQQATGQQILKGKIYDKQSDSLLAAVTVFNASSKAFSVSSKDGAYAIQAAEGDRLVFTAVGYVADTVKVLNYMIDAGYDVTMIIRGTTLRAVTVKGRNYQADSLERREDYAAYYNRPKTSLVSKTGPSNGVGMAFSPIGFFAGRSKNKKMGKNLEYQEEQDFIDYSFNPRYIEKITNLHGDSLTSFVVRNRPSYEFCRAATSGDMIAYINDRLILFRQGKDPNEKDKH